MFGLDDRIVELGTEGAPLVAVLVALLLGIRHATDPDHLVAVSTLVASERSRPARRATVLGACWGLGHGATLLGLGLPLVLTGFGLPQTVQRGAEALVGLVIAMLAIQLVRRWRARRFHVHVHDHDGRRHRHLHAHEASERPEDHTPHDHRHEHVPVRRPAQAFGIGLLHGVGGSAPVVLLLLAPIEGRAAAVILLAVFALVSASSMALISTVVGYALTRGPMLWRPRVAIPALGVLSLAFGTWYAASAFAGLA